MIRAIVIAALCFASVAFGQAVGGGGVPGAGGSGGSGFPITLGSTSVAASSTTTSLAGMASLQNVKYLSCSSELGAQVTAAATALGAAGGVIVFPNCTTATWTTATSQLPKNISYEGYGQQATIITCSVAGDCLNIHQAVSPSESASTMHGFTMLGSGASNQVLINGEGLSGWTIYDLNLDGSSTNAVTTCMEFHNTTAGATFTEWNNVWADFGIHCTPSVNFLQDAGDASISYAYNNFNFRIGTQAGAYGIVFNGNGIIYGGTLNIYCNHIGPTGGCVQFNNGFNASGVGNAAAGERLFITAEENGTGAGTVLTSTGTGVLFFQGEIFNGSQSANALATLTSIAGGSIYTLYGVTDMANNTVNASSFNIKVGTNDQINISETGAGAGTAFLSFLEKSTGIPVYLASGPTGGNAIGWRLPSTGAYMWSSATDNSGGPDTGISRTAADTMAFGNGTSGDFSGAMIGARVVLKGGTVPTITGCGTISSQSGGSTAGSFVTSTTGTCTAAFALPTVTHGYTCSAQDITQHVAANALFQSATSTTGCTVTGTTVANDVITFTAFGW